MDAMIEARHPGPNQWPHDKRIEATLHMIGDTLMIARDEFRNDGGGLWTLRDRRETRTTLDELRQWAACGDAPVADFYATLLARAEALMAEERRRVEKAADEGPWTVGIVSDTGGATWRVFVEDRLGRDQFFAGPTNRLRRHASEGGSHPTYALACQEAIEVHARIKGPATLDVPDLRQSDIDRYRLGQSIEAMLGR